MPASGDLHVRGDLTIPAAELGWRFSHASGPGGQGVNTASSRVELGWDVAASAVLSAAQRNRLLERLPGLTRGVLTVRAAEHRAQLRNREAARERLSALVLHALAPPPRTRRATRPTRGSTERRLKAKKRRTDVKHLRRRPSD
ncbi:MAG: alternative ribosome rescue aminoacyl-tRNA hydrolase ArfB [Cellulomonadaceae bacterium]